jgi:hypothetical protein
MTAAGPGQAVPVEAGATAAEAAAMAAELRRCRRFGWTSLLVWALFGLILEAAHGFKLAVFLDDDLRRTLLRLGHAHGAVLALVVLAYGEAGARLHAAAGPARRVGRLLRAAALLIPAGFALSAVRASEGDPSLAILTVPLGAVLLLAALGWTALAAWRGERA